MFKFVVVLLALIACVAAKPGLLAAAPLAYTAPAGVVTATSSQVIARNHNGLAAASYVAAPAVVAPLAAAPLAAAPLAAAPLAAAPLAAAPLAAAPFAYSAPLTYAAAPVLV